MFFGGGQGRPSCGSGRCGSGVFRTQIQRHHKKPPPPPRLHHLCGKVRATFAFFPMTRVRIEMHFFVLGGFFQVGFPPVHFQYVITRWGISSAPGTSLGTSPCTRARMTLVHRLHTQQNEGKQVSFSEKPLETPPEVTVFASFVQREYPGPRSTAKKDTKGFEGPGFQIPDRTLSAPKPP